MLNSMRNWLPVHCIKNLDSFNTTYMQFLMKRETVELNKPIYTGFSVLELSKTLMYNFHYTYMAQKYGQSAKLLFTDTDSLCYQIYTHDIYQDMLHDRDTHFDTSDYEQGHKLYSVHNKKTIGMMKDETNGIPVSEFVGLRSKMYSIKCGGVDKKRAKGINKSVVENNISHEDYKQALFSKQQMNHLVVQFRNLNHQIYTVENNKASLSPFDDKRYILNDGVETLAYGHKNIDLL